MAMLENNRISSSPSLERVDDQLPPVVITAEAVASMTVEAMDEELRQMGLAPDQPLPTTIRHIIDDKNRSLWKVGHYKYLVSRLYRGLPNLTSIPKCLDDGCLVRRIAAAIMLPSLRHQANLSAVSTILILVIALIYINLNGGNEVLKPMTESAIKLYGDVEKGAEQQSIHKPPPGPGGEPMKDMFLSSEDI